MAGALGWLGEVTGLGAATLSKLLVTAALFIALWLIRWTWIAVTYRRTDDPRTRYRWRKAATYSLTIAGFILIGRVWLEGIQSLVTYLGLVSAGIAISLRDPIVNWFGWLFIGWRRPFTIGDRVQIGAIAGDIIDIGVSTFSLLEVASPERGEQSTGRIVHVPNGRIFVDPLTNMTQGFNYVWNEIPITITFESDWRRAKAILEGILRDHVESVSEEAAGFIRDASRKFLIRSAGVNPRVYTQIVSDGVELSLRYVCEARSRRPSSQVICEAILQAFLDEPSIDFAYKTSRIFRQTEEGKPELRI
ncbi:mechanosensitive ion channel family protein [Candidatus Bipolaricaulota bacterium]|nr:mechanosensitive ion channel family protein [Candidatus Bipolaricaulota bacterium]